MRLADDANETVGVHQRAANVIDRLAPAEIDANLFARERIQFCQMGRRAGPAFGQPVDIAHVLVEEKGAAAEDEHLVIVAGTVEDGKVYPERIDGDILGPRIPWQTRTDNGVGAVQVAHVGGPCGREERGAITRLRPGRRPSRQVGVQVQSGLAGVDPDPQPGCEPASRSSQQSGRAKQHGSSCQLRHPHVP